MKPTLFLLLICFYKVESKIVIDVTSDSNDVASVHFYGDEFVTPTDDDIASFCPDINMMMQKYFGKEPTNIYFTKPTPWGDLYDRYDWEPVMKKIEVTYAKVNSITTKRDVVTKQDYDNPSENSINVDVKLTHVTNNTMTTAWQYRDTRSSTVSLGFPFEVQFKSVGDSGNTENANTTTGSWGIEETKTEAVTIGSKHNLQTKLEPGHGVTAELSAKTINLVIEVGYKMSLHGALALNFNPPHNGHHFYSVALDGVMDWLYIPNEKKVVGTLKLEYNIGANLVVKEKALKK